MSEPVLELPPVDHDDLVAITKQVWSSFLDVELTAVTPEDARLSAPVLTATVGISGAWEGRVLVECSAAHAAAAARRMFSTGNGVESDEEARDALGELANVVAGNLKSLLPAPSALSMPSVVSTDLADVPHAPQAVVVRRVAFAAAPGALHVSIWKAETQ